MSEIRSSASAGVRAPTSRVIAADTGMRHNANRMYAGARSALATMAWSIEFVAADTTAARHSRTAGNMAIPQTIVWTITMAVAVTATRKVFTAAHHDDGQC